MGSFSLGGLSSLGTGGRLSLSGGGQKSDAHVSVHGEIEFGITRNRKILSYQGPVEDLLGVVKSYQMKDSLDDGDLPTGTDDDVGDYGRAYVSNMRIVRGNGNVGTLTVTVTQNRHSCLIGVDFAEVQRPIMTWRSDSDSDKPDLAKIAEWKRLESSDWNSYASWISEGSTKLSGNTKKLAQMIFKGIDTYSVYAPVISITAITAETPKMENFPIGEYVDDKPKTPYGWNDSKGRDLDTILAHFDKPWKWIRTDSKATPNSDGTYTWTMQYQGCDGVDDTLYSEE